MTSVFEQPMVKLLRQLQPTIQWLESKGVVEASEVPPEHIDAIKQLERIGVVHKRNNRNYELRKVRLQKIMDSIGLAVLTPLPPAPVVPANFAPEATEIPQTVTGDITSALAGVSSAPAQVTPVPPASVVSMPATNAGNLAAAPGAPAMTSDVGQSVNTELN